MRPEGRWIAVILVLLIVVVVMSVTVRDGKAGAQSGEVGASWYSEGEAVGYVRGWLSEKKPREGGYWCLQVLEDAASGSISGKPDAKWEWRAEWDGEKWAVTLWGDGRVRNSWEWWERTWAVVSAKNGGG